MSDVPAEALPSGASTAVGEAERRQLTVMFCDLAGSTALSHELDPEDLREVMRAYYEAANAVIERFDGQIAKYLGDGLLAYFGYPRAHEDDPVRAVSAALALVDELPILNARVQERVTAARARTLELRIGVHTGLVVIGDLGAGASRDKQAIVGETPNLAARLQEIAPLDTVAISDVTRRLVTGAFVLEDLGRHALKGVPEPVPVFRAVRWSGVRSRLELAAAAGLTPLVGRQQEVGLLLDRWEQVQDGTGQVIFVSGDAGMGKSRMLQVLRDRLADEPHTWLECRCSAYHENSALYPIIGLLEQGLLFAPEDSADDKLAKLERAQQLAELSLEQTVPLFAALLSLPLPDRYAPPLLSPEAQRRKTLEALAAWFFALTRLQPLIMVVEDLHWIDPSTLEYLGSLVEQAPTAPVLLVFTFRPTFQPPWSRRSQLSHLTLNRVTRKQVISMVTSIAGGKSLPSEVVEQLVAKTDGVPLFVEELTKMVLESGLLEDTGDCYALQGSLPSLAIPSTLQDSLTTRLDRLGPVKEVAHISATLGRDFSYELIAALYTKGEPDLQHALAQLVEAELLYQRGTPPQATYSFKHALIQEAAYQSLLKTTRQQYHSSIASTLEVRFPQTVAAQPELLAHHCTEAGLTERAVKYWERAGQRAAERSANLEAINHLTKAVELIRDLPISPLRLQQELELHVALAVPLQLVKGYAAPEVEATYARARELCQEVGETPQTFPVLHGLWRFHLVRDELRTARELAQSLLRMAETTQDPEMLLLADWATGATSLWMGDLQTARTHLERVIARSDVNPQRSLALTYGSDPKVTCLIWLSLTLWALGFPDQAVARINEAVAVARRLAHPFTLAWAIAFAAGLHQLRGEADAAQQWAREVIELATEQSFPLWYGMGVMLQTWAVSDATGSDIPALQQAMATLASAGQELASSYFIALLSLVYDRAGRTEEALQFVVGGLALAERSGESFYEAELHRLRGELALRAAGSGDLASDGDAATEAEACFRRALDLNRRQGAKSFELRATISLARLLSKRRQATQARHLLATMCDWFTEGFATADLKEATALLEQLA